MKIVKLGDTHFGCRGNNEYFYNKQVKFFKEQLLPYMKEHNINTIIQTGDLFDIRKNISLVTLHKAKRDIFDPIRAAGIKFYTLAGNHDLAMRNSSEVYTSPLVLAEYENVRCVYEFETLEFDGKHIDFVGWLCKDNEKRILDKIKLSGSDYCVGHFELSNFPMFKGIDAHGGWDDHFLSHYDRVITGHYHTKSQKDNIDYVGVPYEMCFSDADDPKGFHVFNTKDGSLEFCVNTDTIHHLISYPLEDPLTTKLEKYAGKIVDLQIMEKDKHLAKFIDRLYKCKPHLLSFSDFTDIGITAEDIKINTQSTISILVTAVEESDMNNKDAAIGIIKEVYGESLQ